jgi:hypothetical protein
VGIVPPGVVTDPLVSFVNVRRFRMSGLVREMTLRRGATLLRSARRAALLRAIGRLRIAAKRLGTASGRRARMITTLRRSAAFCPSAPFLREAGNRAQKND